MREMLPAMEEHRSGEADGENERLEANGSEATQVLGEIVLDERSEAGRSGVGRIQSLSDVKAVEEPEAAGSRQQQKAEAAVSKVLWKQIRNLTVMEKEVQERSERQRIEHLVQKVEDEVEYEGILDEMCMKVRADDEAMEMERREREWELERREVRLEEEVLLLKSKIRRLEDDLRVAQVEKNYLLHRKQDEIDEVVRRLVSELKDDESIRLEGECRDIKAIISAESDDRSNEIPSQEVLAAFQDLLKEADERHEREKQVLEDALRVKEDAEEGLRREKLKLRTREKQMECQMVALEKEIARIMNLLREKDAALLVEKERRKSVQEEADKLSSMLKDERSGHRVAMAKLKKLEVGTQKVKEKVVREQAELCKDGLKDLDKDLARLCLIFSQKKEVPKTEGDQLDSLKKQRDAAVADRDKLEEKLNLLLRRSRDREAEIDAMWLEREKILIAKMTALEEQVEHWEVKCRRVEAEFVHERKMWEQDSQAPNHEEIHALEGMITERDARLKDLEEKMNSLLEAKDFELQTIKAMQRKLRDALALSKKEVEEMKALVRQQEGAEADKPDRSGSEESEADSCVDVESVATEMQLELKRLSKEMRFKEETLENEKREVILGRERLHLERKELERKMADTLSLMEDLKKEMTRKDEQTEAAFTSKTAEVGVLRKKLHDKELEMEGRVNRFESEIQVMEQAVEKERGERQKALDSYFVSKKKLSTEVKIKEEVWEKDMERTMQELTSLRAELRRKMEEEKGQECELARLKQEKTELSEKLRKIEAVTSVNTLRASIEEKRNAEWKSALAKVAVFDKQITDAMHAIQTLREELSAKESELLKARTEPEAEWERREEEWTRQRECEEATWHKREQELLAEKDELVKLLETSRAEAAAATSRRGKSSHAMQEHATDAKEGKEVDLLRSRLDELERKLAPEKTKPAKDDELHEALLHVEKEMFLSPDRRKRLAVVAESSGSSLTTTLAKSYRPADNGLWNIDGPLSCIRRFPAEDKFVATEEHGQDLLALSLPARQQKKWIVDSSWMERVRKEHVSLTQQLLIERQRVAALGQVEADNRCMEAMMLRALEQKKECEAKLSQLERKFAGTRATR